MGAATILTMIAMIFQVIAMILVANRTQEFHHVHEDDEGEYTAKEIPLRISSLVISFFFSTIVFSIIEISAM